MLKLDPPCVDCSNYLEAIVLLIVWLIMLITKLVLWLLLVEVGLVLVMMLLMILLLMIKSEALVIKVE
jgi:hypothetical protein